MNATIGIDIGGTKIAAAVADATGLIAAPVQVPTPAAAGPDHILRAAVDAAHAAVSQCGRDPVTVTACGVGTAGTVDRDGVISFATDVLPGWAGTDVRTAVAKAIDLPTVVLNDVHATAIGEVSHGAAAGCGDAVVVALGTGIGGALIQHGAVVTGRTGSAGSVGHIPVPGGDKRSCTCGGAGHLEAYASGPAIAAQYQRLTGKQATLPQIASWARSGAPDARHAIDQAAEALGTVLGMLVNVFDPEVIVIAGGVSALFDLLLPGIQAGLAAQALPGPGGVVLRPAALGWCAALVGAAVAARSLRQ